MNDDDLRTAYRTLLTTRQPDGRSACATPETLLALAERTAPEESRLGTLDHVMACGDCLREFELLRSLAEASRPSETLQLPTWRNKKWFVPLAAAASIAVVAGGAVFWNQLRDGGPDVERGGVVAPVAAIPRGEITRRAALSFVWTSVPGTTRYELVLSDHAERVLYRVSTVDTTATLPDTVTLAPRGEYRWQAVAQSAGGARLASPVAQFRVAAP